MVVEDRPIMSVKYCLPVLVFHFSAKVMHPAAWSLCHSWACWLFNYTAVMLVTSSFSSNTHIYWVTYSVRTVLLPLPVHMHGMPLYFFNALLGGHHTELSQSLPHVWMWTWYENGYSENSWEPFPYNLKLKTRLVKTVIGKPVYRFPTSYRFSDVSSVIEFVARRIVTMHATRRVHCALKGPKQTASQWPVGDRATPRHSTHELQWSHQTPPCFFPVAAERESLVGGSAVQFFNSFFLKILSLVLRSKLEFTFGFILLYQSVRPHTVTAVM